MTLSTHEKNQLIADVAQSKGDIQLLKYRLIGNPEMKELGFIQEAQDKFECHNKEIADLKIFKQEQTNLKFKIIGIVIGTTATFSAFFCWRNMAYREIYN